MQDRPVDDVLAEVVARVREAIGAQLQSVVLFGSAAEGRLRPASDVNVLFVLTAFYPSRIAAATGALDGGSAAIRLDPMFILESEIPDAAEAFAVKFADIARRRRVLFGPDPFEGLKIDRPAQVRRLRQVLLNLILRLRRGLALHANDAGQLSAIIAAAAAPLRAAASSLRDLTGEPAMAPREALAAFAAGSGLPGSADLLGRISRARDLEPLADGAAFATVAGMLDLAQAIRDRVHALSEDRRQ